MLQPHVQEVAANNVLIALGSNTGSFLGDAKTTVFKAFDFIEEEVGKIRKKSKLYETPCFPVGFGPDYVNAAVSVVTNSEPSDILLRLHNIETYFGRERLQRWGSRSLDLDLLAVGDMILPNRTQAENWIGMPLSDQANNTPDELILPHPRIQDRPFVLVPLLDVADDWKHPVLGLSVAEMLDHYPMDEISQVKSVS
ncbi:2-amino-4-hydroxy-6-hydroxymethyldihydropteridine diphosphokinase [Parasulfitobacter algicola]|uniref:2-amino-4-hydroxy-6-hydroxymethyldihydropteridine pyrophosphokinase n=1 Tax=Parasulfitobacter algicola TaxID=2614809 RepID=A0ABX2IM30_9RHOB|nr:2-amino-4-hydroxy-6-hydroxymethyldihydropteridine diphosphokinase [Sulfitobacter algicola]NSX53941.1 2-amino-4-hydroxy-6-hydroxymethyldihydropteridine diphosphokinase [Sulfitobacter algicola]